MPTLRQAAKDDITLIHELACRLSGTYRTSFPESR